MKKKVKILDSAFAHCNYSNNPLPPLQECKWMEWDRIPPTSYLDTLFVTENHIVSQYALSFPGKKIAWPLECRLLHPTLNQWLISNYHLYTNIISHDRDLVNAVPNGIWVPFGGCWVHESDWKLHQKTKKISIVASEKNYLPGHQMRHKIIDTFRDKIDLFGRGYNPIENKIDSLRDYQFQIVIENAEIPGWFTEKLIDCFVTGTIPIYWGDPTISQIFDTTGMIVVKDLEHMSKIINDIDSIDLNQFTNGMQSNFEIAKDYILTENYIYTNYPNLYE
jgi:hypothetical protein